MENHRCQISRMSVQSRHATSSWGITNSNKLLVARCIATSSKDATSSKKRPWGKTHVCFQSVQVRVAQFYDAGATSQILEVPKPLRDREKWAHGHGEGKRERERERERERKGEKGRPTRRC